MVRLPSGDYFGVFDDIRTDADGNDKLVKLWKRVTGEALDQHNYRQGKRCLEEAEREKLKGELSVLLEVEQEKAAMLKSQNEQLKDALKQWEQGKPVMPLRVLRTAEGDDAQSLMTEDADQPDPFSYVLEVPAGQKVRDDYQSIISLQGIKQLPQWGVNMEKDKSGRSLLAGDGRP